MSSSLDVRGVGAATRRSSGVPVAEARPAGVGVGVWGRGGSRVVGRGSSVGPANAVSTREAGPPAAGSRGSTRPSSARRSRSELFAGAAARPPAPARGAAAPGPGYVYSDLEDEVLGGIGHPLASFPEEVSFSSYAEALDVLEARLEALRFRAAHLQRLEGSPAGWGEGEGGLAVPPPRVVVGVTGPPGSGKSTLVQALVSREPGARVALPMDGFHRPQRWLDAQPDPAEAHRRRGAPFTFDAELFADAVSRAAPRGAALRAPGWDHAAADPVPDAVEVAPSHAVVFPEGNYLLLDRDPWAGIAPLCTEVWYLDVDPEEAAERLRARHVRAGHSERDARERAWGSDADNGRIVRRCRNRATLAIKLPEL